jgi:(heptosyl)LPS beta-1,4-glucosyltransferase
MVSLSVVMIVKNEAERLQKCFAQLNWVSEILVLDNGSSDSTPLLAAKLGASVHHQSQWQGFGLARQQAVNLAANDYVFSLDADEIVSESLKAEIVALMQSGFGDCAYRVPVKSFYLGKPIRFCGWQNEKHLRIFDRRLGNYNAALVHESVNTTQAVKELKSCLFHHTYPTKAVHKAKMKLYGDLGARKMLAQGKGS